MSKFVSCTNCDKDILRTRRYEGNTFCSHPCYGEWKQGKPRPIEDRVAISKGQTGRVLSEQTKEKIGKANSKENNGMYGRCKDQHPNWKGGKIKKKCDQYRVGIEVWPFAIKEKNYCSQECHNIDKTVENRTYCLEWQNIEYKNEIFKRDNYICKNPVCWRTSKRLVRHHIDYDKTNCQPSNLITLCNSCNIRANADRDWWIEWYRRLLNV